MRVNRCVSLNEDPESAAAKEPEGNAMEPSFWASFTQADMRTLVVTIAGTVIGGALLVMVVAVAVVILRSWDSPSSSDGWGVFATVVLIAILGTTLTAPGRAMAQRRKRFWIVSLAPWLVVVLVIILALLGRAAGVK